MNDYLLFYGIICQKYEGELEMLFRKKIEQGNRGDVAFVNGTVQFQAVKLNVYSFVVDGIAIDAGSQSLEKQFQSFFEEQSIDELYCTHIHEDHTGGAAWFQERNIPVYLHQSSISEAEKKGEYPLYRKMLWGKRQPFKAQPTLETFSSRKYKWKSIFTPGHSYDHTVFLNTSTGQLFTGDLFLQVKTKLIMDNESVPETIRSLEQVLVYDFEEMFCSHAGYISNGKEKLREKLDYLLHVSGEVQRLNQQGKSVEEIQNQLFPRMYPITKLSFSQWDSKHIVTSILEA